MKIIHNQTNINGFSLALTVVRLPPTLLGTDMINPFTGLWIQMYV